MKPPQIRRSVPRVSSYHSNGHCLSFIPPGPRTKGLCTSRPDPAMIFQNLVGLWQVYKKRPVIRALAHLLLNLEDSVQVEVLGRPAGQPRQCLSPEKGRKDSHVGQGGCHTATPDFSRYTMLKYQGQGGGRGASRRNKTWQDQ